MDNIFLRDRIRLHEDFSETHKKLISKYAAPKITENNYEEYLDKLFGLVSSWTFQDKPENIMIYLIVEDISRNLFQSNNSKILEYVHSIFTQSDYITYSLFLVWCDTKFKKNPDHEYIMKYLIEKYNPTIQQIIKYFCHQCGSGFSKNFCRELVTHILEKVLAEGINENIMNDIEEFATRAYYQRWINADDIKSLVNEGINVRCKDDVFFEIACLSSDRDFILYFINDHGIDVTTIKRDVLSSTLHTTELLHITKLLIELGMPINDVHIYQSFENIEHFKLFAEHLPIEKMIETYFRQLLGFNNIRWCNCKGTNVEILRSVATEVDFDQIIRRIIKL